MTGLNAEDGPHHDPVCDELPSSDDSEKTEKCTKETADCDEKTMCEARDCNEVTVYPDGTGE